MLDVQRDKVPNGFLLILSPEMGYSRNEVKLTQALLRATRSEQYAVLVDCSLLEDMSEEAVELLLAYSFVLHAQQRRLVLCHVPDAMRHQFLHTDQASQPLLAPTLLDAVHDINHPIRQPARA